MYKIFKIFFLLSLVTISGVELKYNPDAIIFWVLASLLPFIGIFMNKEWGYISALIFGCFVILALIFVGFYGIEDYVIFILSLLLVILAFPTIIVLRNLQREQ